MEPGTALRRLRRAHRSGTKDFRHLAVGDLTLRFEAPDVAGVPGLAVIGYTAEPGSPSQEVLLLLASWADTERAGASVEE
ncbi:hypothetical protein ACGFYT_14520 [Streptomyces sp. NPDC048208]|uniref:MmyB family transcriptional regulator n=1 Tax=Streptomyces sp. NPDC048208 TaxID=3365515 RepID=UPI0037140EFF